MNTSKVSYLLFTLSLILISHAPIHASCQKLFETLCTEVGNFKDYGQEDPRDCLKLLKTDQQITTATNYVDLSKFILDLTIEKAKQGQNLFKNLSKTNPNSRAFFECPVYYDQSISSFESARKNLTAGVDDLVLFGAVGIEACKGDLDAEKTSIPTALETSKTMVLLYKIAYLATKHIT